MIILTAGACSAHPQPAHPANPAHTDAPRAPLACPEWSPLPFGSSLYASSTGAPLKLAPTCVPKASHGCAYAFELDGPQRVKLALMTEDFDGALALFGEGGDHSGELVCAEDTPEGDTHHARIERVLGAGRYVAFVTAPLADAGRFELFAEREAVPSESAVCAAAPVIHPGETRRGTTEGHFSHFLSACAGGDGPDAVFAFALDAPARVRVRQQTSHDGILSLRALFADSCSELSCSDDFVDGEHAQVTRALPAGHYAVVSDGYGSVTGAGTFALSYGVFPIPPVPTRAALCAAAPTLPLDGTAIEVDTLTRPALLRGSCTEGDAPEALYRFSLRERSMVSFTLESAELHAALYLLRNCEDAKSEQGCAVGPRTDRAFSAEAGPTHAHDVLVEDLAAGDYTLVVDGATSHAMGALTLRARTTSGELPAL